MLGFVHVEIDVANIIHFRKIHSLLFFVIVSKFECTSTLSNIFLAKSLSMVSAIERAFGITHDSKTDPIRWNRQWENCIRDRAATSRTLRGMTAAMSDEIKESLLSSHLGRLKLIEKLQLHLSDIVAYFPDLADRWRSTSELNRQEHILEGLVRTCGNSVGKEADRLWCHGYTLSKLQLGNGQGFLDLLDKFLVKQDAPVTPLILEDPQWDKLVGKSWHMFSEKDKVFEAYSNGVRTSFIGEQLHSNLPPVKS